MNIRKIVKNSIVTGININGQYWSYWNVGQASRVHTHAIHSERIGRGCRGIFSKEKTAWFAPYIGAEFVMVEFKTDLPDWTKVSDLELSTILTERVNAVKNSMTNNEI